MVKLSDELKKAITHLPDKEKNKLLLRLIARDKILTEKLTHQLLESADAVDERAEEIRKVIIRDLPSADTAWLTPGYLMMDMRPLNAKISHHLKITRDKFGAVSLTILLLLEAFRRHLKMLEKFPRSRSATFTKYVTQRLKFIFKHLAKLHEDYFMEIEDDLNELLEYVYQFDSTAETAKEEGFPRKWER